jgi:uncharacterized protein
MTMKRFVCAAILTLCICALSAAQQVPADTPASKEDVEKYFQVMHSRDMMTKMVVGMARPIHDMIHEQYLKRKDKLPPDFEERMNRLMDEQFRSFPWDEMLESMVPIYQKHLTKSDLDSLVAFYGTAAGQKLLRELPAITAEAMQSMRPFLQKNLEAMNERIEKEIIAVTKDTKTEGSPSVAPKRD